MEKFEVLTSKAAPLPLINIDTEMMISKQFLKTIKRARLGKNLFHQMH
jgi:3-isopropylmalate/(R)-2-methylmalate dehydratase small subunit